MMGFTRDVKAIEEAVRWLITECRIRASGIDANKDIIAEIMVLYLERQTKKLNKTVLLQRAYLAISPYNQTDLMLRGAIEMLNNAYKYLCCRPYDLNTPETLGILDTKIRDIEKELKEMSE